MSNVRKIVHIEARPGQADAVRAALLELEAATVTEPGCIGFSFFQALSAPHSFVLIEDFQDRAAFDAHLALPHTRAFFALDLVAATRAVEKEWLS